MLILALAIVAVLGPNLLNAIVAIAIVNIPGFARLVRGQTLSIREQEFVQAAHALGASMLRVMIRHVWPSVAGNIIVYASLRACLAMFTESSLAFLGPRRPPPHADVGPDARHPPWSSRTRGGSASSRGVAIFLTALAFNFLGDGVRDVMDARIED
jgi:peptide/nickel transport system permease protein